MSQPANAPDQTITAGLDECTLERIIPDHSGEQGATGVKTLNLHLARYEFAAAQLKAGCVLDIACGVGYGTDLLGRCPGVRRVVGVDLDLAAVRYAQQRYPSANSEFICADAMTFAPEGMFQTIVSLETMEHVPDPESLFARLVSFLAPGGVLISSVPVTLSTDANPHHATDFTEASFRRLGAHAGLRVLAEFRQIQPYSPLALLRKTETRAHGVRRGLASYYMRHPGKLALRCLTTVRYGFENRYLTVAWEKPA